MGKKKRNAVLDSIQFFFFMLGVRIIRWCSLRGAYRWARFVGWLFYSVDLKHRNRTIRHILHSGIVTDRKEAKKLALKSMIHMVKVFVEIIKFDQIVNEENFYEHIRIADNEGSQKLYNRETAVQTICATGHIGNTIVKELIKENFEVRLLVRKIDESIKDLPVDYRVGNVFEEKFLASNINKGDTVIHLAGIIDLKNKIGRAHV